MKKIKSFFETPKKAVLSCLCILAAIALVGVGTVYAVRAVSRGNSIGTQSAQNFAFADAGVDPASAQVVRTEFEFEQGQFVYEVEFIANGVEYDYWVKASDGAIVKKEMERNDSESGAGLTAQVTQEQARETALSDAGVLAADATFTNMELRRDDGMAVYEISFYTADTKYEYEINAETGAIYSKVKETYLPATQEGQQTTAPQPLPSQPGQASISLEEAKNVALSDAGVSPADATFTKAQQDYDDGIALYDIEFYTSTHKYEYEVNAANAGILARETEEFSSGQQGGSAYIGVDQAKSIAAEHAGLSNSTVTFSKAKLENDDGMTVYEVEFFYQGTEYDYKIDASTGSILEYDLDRN